MNDNAVIGIPRAVRSYLYLGAIVASATLTPIAVAVQGTVQTVLTAIVGGLGTMTATLARLATPRTK